MDDVEICTLIEPQNGASYDDQLAFAQATESLGFHGFFRSDHFVAFSGDGMPGPSESWTILAGLARGRAVEVPDSSHAVYLDQPEEWMRLLADFLKESLEARLWI